MSHESYRSPLLLLLSVIVLGGFAMVSPGCGTVQEGMNEDGIEEDWSNTPPISVTARLEYRIDSLMNENRKLQQQLEASTTESRNLSARNAELDGKVREAATMQRPVFQTPAPTPTATKAPSGGTYQEALAKYKSRNFQAAIDNFNELINNNVKSSLLDNCHYWIGESYFGMKNYSEAIRQFEAVTGMSGSDKRDDAQYMIGNSYLQIGKKEEARGAFQKLISLYPSSPLAKRAKTKIN